MPGLRRWLEMFSRWLSIRNPEWPVPFRIFFNGGAFQWRRASVFSWIFNTFGLCVARRFVTLRNTPSILTPPKL